MSYDAQRGGISKAPDPFAVPEVQLDCDGTGGSTCYPAAQDKPLMQVGTYSLPDAAMPDPLTVGGQNVKKAPGTVNGAVPVIFAGS